MLTRPETPHRPKIARRPCEPQMIELVTVAPASICLFGQILTFGCTIAPSSTTVPSPTTAPSNVIAFDLIEHCRPMIAPRISARSPMYELRQITDRSTVARESMIVSSRITLGPWMTTPSLILAASPRKIGP